VLGYQAARCQCHGTRAQVTNEKAGRNMEAHISGFFDQAIFGVQGMASHTDPARW
jgi:hypothetical protein